MAAELAVGDDECGAQVDEWDAQSRTFISTRRLPRDDDDDHRRHFMLLDLTLSSASNRLAVDLDASQSLLMAP